MAFDGADALGVESEIVEERGRWAVYLIVVMWTNGAGDQPFERVRRRIRDYATRADAEVGRSWMVRAASRERPFESRGF